MKKCSKCKVEKISKSFSKDKSTTSGLCGACKECNSASYKRWYENGGRKWQGEYYGKWMENGGREMKRDSRKRYMEDEGREVQKRWVAKGGRELQNRYREKWLNNGGRKLINEYAVKRRKDSHALKLGQNMGSQMRQALEGKKAGRKWETLAGYTVEDLVISLESKFDSKMGWNNYGSYWVVDHIYPQSRFIFETAEDTEFKKCWALENLQPLERIANIKKGNKIIN